MKKLGIILIGTLIFLILKVLTGNLNGIFKNFKQMEVKNNGY